jgi:V8-like Glu-specific endopeptidase
VLRNWHFVAVFLIAMAPSASEPGFPKGFSISRSRVVNIDMRTAFRKDPPVQLVQNEKGFSATKVITHFSDVAGLRLHIIFKNTGEQTTWKLQIFDATGTLVETLDERTREDRDGGVWTDRISGSSATVIATSGAVGSLLIDRYTFAVTPSFPESIYGADDRVGVPDGPPKWRSVAPAVGRLRFIIPDGEATCTGFLFASDLIMTNNHCIQSEGDLDAAYMDFDYETSTSVIHSVRCSKLEFTNFGLDVSVIRLSESLNDRVLLKLAGNGSIVDNASLAILEHGGGAPMQLSLTDCRVRGTNLQGQSNIVSDFGHTCDTVGGSSGAPVFDSVSGIVIGLHHFGFEGNDPNPVNQAVYMDKIVSALPASLRGQLSAETQDYPTLRRE